MNGGTASVRRMPISREKKSRPRPDGILPRRVRLKRNLSQDVSLLGVVGIEVEDGAVFFGGSEPQGLLFFFEVFFFIAGLGTPQ